MEDPFEYSGEQFADIQMLRYRLDGFDKLTIRQKAYIYYLSEATLSGRDITTDQFGFFNLRIRKTLEAIYPAAKQMKDDSQAQALCVYLKRVWFSNGIYHHYGCEKFVPGFTEAFFRYMVEAADIRLLPLKEGQGVQQLCDELCPIIFQPEILPKRVNKADGEDLVKTSACNYYQNVTQEEVERYYATKKDPDDKQPPSWGLNSRLEKDAEGILKEEIWKADGMYGPAIKRIIFFLEKAAKVTENEQQRMVINWLIRYYRTGNLRDFDRYSIEWLKELDGQIDFINGFIEVYGDPLGLKASWEGIVEYKDLETTRRTQIISQNAQWFEDHSPIDPRFRKKKVRGVTAHVVNAAMLGGDEYPSTAIGINLPNADWIRAQHGSKSVTIANLTGAYAKAAHGNGFYEEFVDSNITRSMIEGYADKCDNLHTDLHECLGHGSGQLLPDTDPDALKAYGNTIEEARADLFGLYYMADKKLVDLGLLPDEEAYKAQYYTYLMNGLITQLTRIQPEHQIEEAHMRNRALIAHWVYAHSEGCIRLEKRDGRTFLVIHNYEALRPLFAQLLAEIQRIKSEGDYDKARQLVEEYGIRVDKELHEEVLLRYKKLGIAPYKGFLNPWLKPKFDAQDNIIDIEVDYSETLEEQMMRYSRDYAMPPSTQEKLKEIKRSFRLLMNGEVSRSMKEKGVEYKLNWGISLPELQKKAAEYGHDYELAIALWKENIRECKIMAAMIMPPEQMCPEVADIWMSQIQSYEIAEMTSFNLFQHLSYAPALAYQWIATDNEMKQLCGYIILSRLFMNQQMPNDRGISEFLDQVIVSIQDESNRVKKAAITCITRFAELGDEYLALARQALKSLKMEDCLDFL